MTKLTYQYAIRMPNGELFSGYASSDSFLIALGAVTGAQTRCVSTWNSRTGAEKKLQELRDRAADLGVGDWLGVIVQRVCSPFSDCDPAEQFVDEINQWMEGGAQ